MGLEQMIILGIVIVFTLFFGVRLILDIIWNKRLERFQKSNNLFIEKNGSKILVKRMYSLVLSAFILLIVGATMVIVAPNVENHLSIYGAQSVQNENNFKEIIKNANKQYASNDFETGVPKGDAVTNVGGIEKQDRDYIGTNVQVTGVDEADIVKTDGNTIYYATRFTNKIRIFDISLNNQIDVKKDLDLKDLYTDSLYLTETQLIVIGYTYNYRPYDFSGEQEFYRWGYYSFTGSVNIYDRTTLELVYALETDTNFYQHRVVEDALFLISNKSIYDDSLTPVFKEYKNSSEEEITLDYENIYYFSNMPIQSMTVITGINLKTYEAKTEGYLGGVDYIYASQKSLYTVSSFYDYNSFTNKYKNYTQIVKYELITDTAEVKYSAAGRVDGNVSDQYWMDEYNDYFRVVTSTWGEIRNRLFVLKVDASTKDLVIVGSITENLGKEGESVKSVRFNEDFVYIVTFKQIDPLYTIDLSNPKNPVFVSDIEELGFNTYLHKWNDNGLVGFGFTANIDGIITGLKISAYDTKDSTLLDSFQMLYGDFGGMQSYFYSEASYNPKALMISPLKGIIAFPVTGWTYFINEATPYEYGSWVYTSQYYIFYIDFTAENIISKPIIISQEETNYYSGIDRGIYIDNVVYTLSYSQISSFDLNTKEVLETILLPTEYDNK